MKISFAEAVSKLGQGDVVAIPTETVYGLAASLFSPAAIASVFQLKKRPPTNPLIVHIASLQGLDTLLTDFPREARLLAEKFWPGPLTLVLPASNLVPSAARAGLPLVAIRIPRLPLTRALIEEVGPLVTQRLAELMGGKYCYQKFAESQHSLSITLPYDHIDALPALIARSRHRTEYRKNGEKSIFEFPVRINDGNSSTGNSVLIVGDNASQNRLLQEQLVSLGKLTRLTHQRGDILGAGCQRRTESVEIEIHVCSQACTAGSGSAGQAGQ